ncbi:hypothetical protein ACS47_24250 [Bacillus cereus]|uniref:hypothetical protein n=1 Tax=Bacillus paranthracis TaxID=2026186 RepID=UPI000772CFF0|nr:hypothetical protein ACS47_24250 [Bacillus cereus]SME06763.1 hypothetical protein BACERE00183_01373 [Bacillus cereus]
MITNPVAFEKDKLIRSVYSKQKDIAALLLKHGNRQEVAHLFYKWQSHKNFFMQNAAVTKIPLDELKERHKQIIQLLEQVEMYTIK